MKFIIIFLSLFLTAYGYSSMPRLVSRKSMSIKAFDMTTLTTAVEVVAKPDGNSLSLTHPLTHLLTHSLTLSLSRASIFDFSCLLIYPLPYLGYVYGEVAAPSFVLPLFAVLAVLTAAIPFLLRSGKYLLTYSLTHSLTSYSFKSIAHLFTSYFVVQVSKH